MPVLLIVGVAALLLGLILLVAWFGYIIGLIKAVLPVIILVGGAVAAYLGWEEMRDQRQPNIDFSNPDEASRYRAEAQAYQARINEIKDNGDSQSPDIPAAVDENNGEAAARPEAPPLEAEPSETGSSEEK